MIPCFLCLWAGAGGRGRGRGDTPTRHPDPTPQTRHPDPTTRHPTPRPDHPTPRHPKAGAGDASGCKRMQRGKSRCKRMQADASEKARRQGAGGRGKGQGGRCTRQKAQKEKALAVSAWSHVVAWSYAPRLFCAFGSFAPPCPFDPSPLPLAPLLLRLHSACIPLALRLFFPFAFRFHSAFIPCASLGVSGGRVVGSGCRVCGVGSGCRVGVSPLPLPRGRVGVSGRGVASPPAPAPCPCPKTAPLPPLPPLPVGRGGVKFAPPSLSLGGRFLVL